MTRTWKAVRDKTRDVKPHITAGEARKAVEEVDRWRTELAA
jgi:hypothetical protein